MVHAVFRHMRNTKGFVTAFGIAIVGLARAAGAQEVAAGPTPVPGVVSPADEGLDDLSLLLETQVTSVSRHAELASEAPASVSVVTAEEIRRQLILVGGHAMNSQIAYTQSYLGGDAPLDMSVIERIEIIKGPASATLLNRRITDPVVADHKPVVQIDQEPRTLHVAIDYRF